jgi:hypothetical protein
VSEMCVADVAASRKAIRNHPLGSTREPAAQPSGRRARTAQTDQRTLEAFLASKGIPSRTEARAAGVRESAARRRDTSQPTSKTSNHA